MYRISFTQKTFHINSACVVQKRFKMTSKTLLKPIENNLKENKKADYKRILENEIFAYKDFRNIFVCVPIRGFKCA